MKFSLICSITQIVMFFLSQKEIDRDYIKQYLNVPPKYLKYIKEGQACCKGIHISKDECNLFIFKR